MSLIMVIGFWQKANILNDINDFTKINKKSSENKYLRNKY